MKRVQNWRSKLHQFFDDVRAVEYDEDRNHCAHYGANGLLVLTGEDPFKPYRKYKKFASAIKAIRKDGFKDHVALFASVLPEIHPSQAKVGDLVVFETDDAMKYSVGFCVGEMSQVLTASGLGSVATLNAVKAFQI